MDTKKIEPVKKVPGPKFEQSRWKITPLGANASGQRMMFIQDMKNQPESGKPFGLAISHEDAMKKFAITKTVPIMLDGRQIGVQPDPAVYDEEDIEISNQVNSYLNAASTGAEPVKAGTDAKRGRPATGRKNYDHAAYQKAYRDRQRQKKIAAANAAKKGI